MLKKFTKLFKRDQSAGGLKSLGTYSKAQQKTKAGQCISASDLQEACFEASSEGWPEPDFSVNQKAPGDVDFFEQDTGVAEFFPTTLSQRQAILGTSEASSPFSSKDEAEEEEIEYATEMPPTQSIRVDAVLVEDEPAQEVSSLPSAPSLPSAASRELLDALCKLPKLLEEAKQAPEATVEALRRVDNLANALKSQQSLQRDATADIHALKSEFDGFLSTVSKSITDLKVMHQAAIDECSAMANDSRQALRSQRMHVVEMRQQQQDTYFRLEDEQNRRIREHETRTGKAMKRVGVACASMLILMTLCVGVFMRYTSSIINSTSDAFQQGMAKESTPVESEESNEAATLLNEIVKKDAAEKPKG